jgi:hypothetical protein
LLLSCISQRFSSQSAGPFLALCWHRTFPRLFRLPSSIDPRKPARLRFLYFPCLAQKPPRFGAQEYYIKALDSTATTGEVL